MSWRPPSATVPAGLDPAMEFVLRTVLERKPDDLAKAWWRVEAGAGLSEGALRKWLYRRGGTVRGPTIRMVRSALNELGYDLAVVELDSRQDGKG